jgi:hypothetical protein
MKKINILSRRGQMEHMEHINQRSQCQDEYLIISKKKKRNEYGDSATRVAYQPMAA